MPDMTSRSSIPNELVLSWYHIDSPNDEVLATHHLCSDLAVFGGILLHESLEYSCWSVQHDGPPTTANNVGFCAMVQLVETRAERVITEMAGRKILFTYNRHELTGPPAGLPHRRELETPSGCPFCNAEARFGSVSHLHYIVCLGCGFRTPSCKSAFEAEDSWKMLQKSKLYTP